MRVYALIIGAWLCLLSGCGGGSNPQLTGTGGQGRATLTVTWPARTRLIPDASNSITVIVTQGTAPVAQQTLARPAAGGASTASFPSLQTGTLSVSATTYPNADGTGVAQATATIPLVIVANQTTSFSITMGSTIDHLDLTAPTASVKVGATLQVSATAKDASGAVVLTTPARLSWLSSATGVATVDATGLVTGVGVGSADISVTDTESGKAAKTTVTVTVTPGGPSNPFLTDGFAYTVGGPVANQNGGTGVWGGPWNEYGQGYTSSVIGTGSLSFGSLTTSGNSIRTTSDFPVGHARAFQTSPGKTGGVLFISYLVKPLDSLNVGHPSTYFELVYGGVSIGKGGGSGFYGLENSGGGSRVDSPVPVVTNQTAFLVVRITFGTGNDTVDLFVNPTPGQPLPAVPDATKSDRNTGTPGDFNFGSSIRCQFDEVRFGRTFADVAPTN
ncbi:MAG: hypothetical protein JWL77_3805 [Chthonomonadaceae bacterium]|nr:hypothetical protein [Chthonomonadaceae bacterium]